ncbi:MAG: cyclic nucleotide-binding domain-containing protein [Rubrivivax sp.]|nr:cyclic nucleotide-binding domain-containing protein [Rubrivivax sp.]
MPSSVETPGAALARTALFAGAPRALIELCVARARTVDLAPGATLPLAAAHGAGLGVLLCGSLRIVLPRGASQGVPMAFEENEVLGAIQAVTGQASDGHAECTAACSLLVFDPELLRTVAQRFANFDARLAQLAARRLRALVFRRTLAALLQEGDARLVEALVLRATEVLLERGSCLMKQGDAADAWYVLTSGRLSVVTEADGESLRGADLLPGASVGEIALITGGVRSATLSAERDCSLMCISQADFERFAAAQPVFAQRLMATVVQRLFEQIAPRRTAAAQVLVLLRASASPQLQGALEGLGAALQHTLPTALCTRAAFEAVLGRTVEGAAPTVSHPMWSRFDVWLEEAQRAHDVVLLDAGHADDPWGRECLLRADRCLWLAEPVAAGSSQPPAELLARLDAAQRWAQRGTRRQPWTLLLAHAPQSEAPRSTRAWLATGGFDRHFHLRVGDAETLQRAARLLTGRATGLALSGGGARGFAHIGVLKALVEAGVPIDCIGGTSMGAIQAGMYAMGLSADEMVALNRYVIGQRPFSEYTLPFIALVASRRRDACAAKCFGDVQIEDLWLPYLAVSTDLHGAHAVVHESGSLTRATAASASVPGVLLPVIDGERVLVDGGIVNNLPADLVKARCGGMVYASKVAPSDDVLAPRGGFPSAWSVLLHRLLPWREPLQTPQIGDLLVRTMTVGSADHMQRVASSIDVLIEPDVDRYGMLQFGAIAALVDRGYAAAQQRLQALAPAARDVR